MIVQIKVATTGASGSATGSSASDVVAGWLEAVKLTYHASAPITTDVTISELGGMERALLTLANANTNATHYPRAFASSTQGVVSTTVMTPIYIDLCRVQVAVADCNPLTDAVVVLLQIRPGGAR